MIANYVKSLRKDLADSYIEEYVEKEEVWQEAIEWTMYQPLKEDWATCLSENYLSEERETETWDNREMTLRGYFDLAIQAKLEDQLDAEAQAKLSYNPDRVVLWDSENPDTPEMAKLMEAFGLKGKHMFPHDYRLAVEDMRARAFDLAADLRPPRTLDGGSKA